MGQRTDGRRRRLTAVQDAARRLFDEQGYEATTIRQIAAAAGVSTGTVMSGGDKASILRGLIEESIGELMPPSVRLDGDPRELVWRCFEPYFAFYDGHPELARPYATILLGTPDPEHTPLREQAVAFTGLVAAQICAVRPTASPDAAQTTAEGLFATYIYALVLWAGGATDVAGASAVLRRQIDWQLSRFEETR